MRTIKFGASNCRHCGFYTPEGRRGGNCRQLGVPVQAEWKACSLAISPFVSNLSACDLASFSKVEFWSPDLINLSKEFASVEAARELEKELEKELERSHQETAPIDSVTS